jgi:class 3 adenylate cyclase
VADAKPLDVKYVFLDVVGFSRGRSIEAQTDVIGSLNHIVASATTNASLDASDALYLPTGDGICIAITGFRDRYDIHLKIALAILAGLATHNDETQDPQRQFDVRIGINENTDNLVTDITGRPNVAGAGINHSQRVMSLGDGGNILASQAAYDRLSQRERYQESFVRYDSRTKHDDPIRVYQYVNPEARGLSGAPPRALKPAQEPEAKLDLCTAHFFGNVLKHHDLIRQHSASGLQEMALTVLMYIMAEDAVARAEARGTDAPVQKLDYNKPIEQLLSEIARGSIWSNAGFARCIMEHKIPPHFRRHLVGLNKLAISGEGIEKLRSDQPDVARAFGLL